MLIVFDWPPSVKELNGSLDTMSASIKYGEETVIFLIVILQGLKAWCSADFDYSGLSAHAPTHDRRMENAVQHTLNAV